jgi:hypothetical protein
MPSVEEIKKASPNVALSYVLAFIIAAIIIKYLPEIITGASDIAKLINVNGILGGILGSIAL